MKKLLFAVIVLAIPFLLAQQAYAAVPINVNMCSELTEPGAFYQLTQNISGRFGATTYCIRIQASDITFDCKGFAIKYDNANTASNGIVTNFSGPGVSGLVIKNCTVTGDFEGAGINLIRVSNSNITESKIIGAVSANLALQQSHNVNVTQSQMDLAFANGIALLNSNGSYIMHNVVRFNGLEGLFMTNSNNNTFVNNTFRANGLNEVAGIALQFSQNNTFIDTSITSSTGAGIRLDVTNNTRFINTYTDKNSPAIRILDSKNVTAYNFSLSNLIVNFTAENVSLGRGVTPFPDQPPGSRHIGQFFDAEALSYSPYLFIYMNYTDAQIAGANITDESSLRIAKFSNSWNSNTTTFASSFGVDTDLNVIFANITNFESTFAPVGTGVTTLADVIQEHLGQTVELSLTSAQASFSASKSIILKRTVQCSATISKPNVINTQSFCYNYSITNTGNVPDAFEVEVLDNDSRLYRSPACGNPALNGLGLLTLPTLLPGESEEFGLNATIAVCSGLDTFQIAVKSTTCSGQTVASDRFTQTCAS